MVDILRARQDTAVRLAIAHRNDVPEGDPDLGDISGLAIQALGMPVALVSLAGTDRHWFSSRPGLESGKMPWPVSFCSHALLQDDLFEVPDARLDPRFAADPLVTHHPQVRFYAGVSLLAPGGDRVGTLSVLDFEPRTLDAQQHETLKRLARLAMTRLELHCAHQKITRIQGRIDDKNLFIARAIEASLEGIVVQNGEGRVLNYNRGAEAILGHARDRMIGKALWDLAVPVRFRDEFKRGFHDQLAAGVEAADYRHMLVALRADGSETVIECVSHVAAHHTGNRLVTFFHDVSALRMKERLHEKLDALVQAFPEVFAYYGPDDRLLLANSSALNRLGLNLQAKYVGRLFEEILREEVGDGVIADAIGREEEWIEERMSVHRSNGAMEIRLANGKWLKLVQSRTSDGGRICVYIDITDIKQRRIELEAALAHAAAAAQVKDDFVSTMSHEMRTPLNALIGLSDALVDSPLDVQQRKWVQTMQASGRQLLHLINDVLDLSQLRSSQLTLVDEAFELRPVLDELMTTAAALPGAGRLAMESTVADSVPAAIRGDRHRLMQILTNLVGNAVKFTPSGSVRLDAWVEVAGDADQLCVEVADSGPGIAADLAEKIFENFVQAESPGQPLRSGTGLGLAIARRLAQAMGGTLVLANPGEPGARFVLRLPCRRVAAQPAAAAPVARSNLPRRVLVVEDTPTSQMVIRLLLEKLGHAVEIVDSGAAALAAFKGGGFDTVLLDLQLPGMDGYVTAQAIRGHERSTAGPRARLVAFSTFSLPLDQEQALAAGIDGCLRKPARLADLAALFETLDPVDRPATNA
jgi:PAS domain S-box-containing protein